MSSLIIRAGLILIRILLVALCAAAMLYALSYPDSLIPPDPAQEYATETTLHTFKPYLWALPWILMEIFAMAGPRRNLVWFTGLGLVLILTVLAWPVIQASTPELVHPTFDYEDGKLAAGLTGLLILLGVSVFIRCVLLRFLFPPPPRDDNEAIHLESSVLNPQTARTVKEIAADHIKVSPHFLYKDADEGLLARFRLLLLRLNQLRARKTAVIIIGLGLLLAWFALYPQPTEQEALQRDIARMYDCVPTQTGYKATTPAVHAAYRVMSHISDHELFAGYTRQQAEQWLHLDKAHPAAYKKQLRDESELQLEYADNDFESRTRFLTVTDGVRTAILYIRTNAAGDKINISEAFAHGWNLEADRQRKILSGELNSQIFR